MAEPWATGDILFFREQLARLVSTGKAKEFIGQNLTHEELKRLTDKEVQKFYFLYLREKISAEDEKHKRPHVIFSLHEIKII